MRRQIADLEQTYRQGLGHLESLQASLLRMEGGIAALRQVLAGIEDKGDTEGGAAR